MYTLILYKIKYNATTLKYIYITQCNARVVSKKKHFSPPKNSSLATTVIYV